MSKNIKKKTIIIYSLIAAFISSLCCFAPIIFVLLGLATASTAAFWGNYLFFGYWWLFLAIGIFLIFIFLLIYWRKHQVCTIDSAKKNRRKIINSFLLSISIFIVFYIFIEVLWELIWIKMGMSDGEIFGFVANLTL